MVPLIGLIIGALIGALIARRRKGNFLDIIQYAASYGILFGLISLFLSIYIVRVYG